MGNCLLDQFLCRREVAVDVVDVLAQVLFISEHAQVSNVVRELTGQCLQDRDAFAIS